MIMTAHKCALLLMVAISVTTAARAQVFGSGGTCIAHANATVAKEAQSACTQAFALAYTNACSANTPGQLVKTCKQALSVAADAIAKIRVSAVASCVTSGNTWGCAAATSFANSQVTAVVKMVSAAIASAYNNCPLCDPVQLTTTVNIFSKLVVQLTAQAAAYTSASVCVGPNQSASALAYSCCISQVYAHGFAYALAKSMIAGGCTNLTADAVVDVNNMLTADPYCACTGYVWVCATDGSGCALHKTGPDLATALSGFGPYPEADAAMYTECQAYAQQLA